MSFKIIFSAVKKIALAPAQLLIKTLENWDLEVNKISASILLAGILAMAAGLVAEGLYGGSEHGAHKAETKRGYTIPGAEAFASGGGAAAPAAEEGPVDIAPFLATADAAAGAGLIKRCTACHTFDKGGKHGVGPNNYSIIGNHHAHASDFAYSEALAGNKDKKWGFQEMSDFLANPKKYLPGTKMAFAGIKNPQERANLIAYINSQSDSPLSLPKK